MHFLLFFLFLVSSLIAGGGPENVCILVNADSWTSLAIANEYISLRKIPSQNIIYFHGLKSHESVSVEYLRNSILRPAIETLEKRALAGQIDYMVYSSDFPTEINIKEDLQTPVNRTLFPYASLTGLTYLYQLVMEKNNRYYRLQNNGYINPPFLGVADTPWSILEKGIYQKILYYLKEREWQKGKTLLEKLLFSHPKSPSLLYNLACCSARLGKKEKAIQFLKEAVSVGWCDYVHTLQDIDLELIRNSQELKKLVEEMKGMQPLYNVHSMGFRNAYNFNEFGAIVKEGEGNRYLLSMMLGITSGRGNSVKEIQEYLRRAEKADSTFPSGTIYYMVNDNIRSRTRQSVFPSAVAVLKEMGIKGKILEGILPSKKNDVMGVMAGTAEFDWKSSGSIIKPGAICEHFTSLGGVMKETSSQTPFTEFLRYGAIASSGTVVEPYALAAKFPNPFLHIHYARGCTAAEAFYQSISAPFQLLIVGDPLCRPWGRKPTVIVKGVTPGEKVKGSITFSPEVEKDYPYPIHNYQMFLAGRRYAVCRAGGSFTLDTTLLLDGVYNIVIVAVEDDPIQNQGRYTFPIRIDNYGYKIQMSSSSIVGWKDTFSLQAYMKEAQEIALFHNGRRLGMIEGQSGQMELNASLLGLGKGELQLVATKKNPQHGAIASIPFEVVPSLYFLPIKIPKSRKIEGLRFILPGKKPLVVLDTQKEDWLKKTKITSSMTWEMDGYYKAAKRDIYQLQILCSGEIEVKINHQCIFQEKKCYGWKYIPIPLVAGYHHLSLKGKSENLNMRLYFGNQGTYSLQGFFHF